MYGSITNRRRISEEFSPLQRLDDSSSRFASYSTFRKDSKAEPVVQEPCSKLYFYSYLIAAVCFALFYWNRNPSQREEPKRWLWDYNAYRARNQDPKHELLLTQQEGDYTDITSLPNRAYARQWGRDYVRFNNQAQSFVDFLEELQSRPDALYNSVALLPSDAIIADLDFDLEALLSSDSLMAVGNQTGVLFFNLKHEYASTAIALWQEFGFEDTSSLSLVASSVGDDDSSVHYLVESPSGFIGDRWIKSILPRSSVIQAKQQTTFELSNAVASVCYRFYPRCEVL